MGQILVRKISEETVERLRLLAEERNVSVEALAREALESAARRKTQDELRQTFAELDAFRTSLPKGGADSTAILRALRDGNEASDT